MKLKGQIKKGIRRFMKSSSFNYDDESRGKWGTDFKKVSIPSEVDGNVQLAYFYQTTSDSPQPLVVSFHSWTGRYYQEDPLPREVLEANFNYIHPDVRGVNDRPESCGSNLIISDFEDAVAFAIKHGAVDPNKIWVFGSSGGGYSGLCVLQKSKVKIQKIQAWNSITDLESWFK